MTTLQATTKANELNIQNIANEVIESATLVANYYGQSVTPRLLNTEIGIAAYALGFRFKNKVAEGLFNTSVLLTIEKINPDFYKSVFPSVVYR